MVRGNSTRSEAARPSEILRVHKASVSVLRRRRSEPLLYGIQRHLKHSNPIESQEIARIGRHLDENYSSAGEVIDRSHTS